MTARRSTGCLQQTQYRGPHRLRLDLASPQEIDGSAMFIADQPEQDMLGAYRVVASAERLAQGELKRPLRAASEWEMPLWPTFAGLGRPDDLVARSVELHPEFPQRTCCEPCALTHQAKELVLGPDVLGTEPTCFPSGQNDNEPCPVRETLEQAHRIAARHVRRKCGQMPRGVCVRRWLATGADQLVRVRSCETLR